MWPFYHQWHFGHSEDGSLETMWGVWPLLFLGDPVEGSSPGNSGRPVHLTSSLTLLTGYTHFVGSYPEIFVS